MSGGLLGIQSGPVEEPCRSIAMRGGFATDIAPKEKKK